MKPLGRKMQKVLSGHQGCSICQPDLEPNKAMERRNAESEIEAQLEEMTFLPGFDEPLSECPCCEPNEPEVKYAH